MSRTVTLRDEFSGEHYPHPPCGGRPPGAVRLRGGAGGSWLVKIKVCSNPCHPVLVRHLPCSGRFQLSEQDLVDTVSLSH
eukprot:1396646-Pyramimonas_sp.AAC.1